MRAASAGNSRNEVWIAGILQTIAGRGQKLTSHFDARKIVLTTNNRSVQLLSVGAAANNVESIDLIGMAGPTYDDLTTEMCGRAVHGHIGLDLRVSRKRGHWQSRQRHDRRRRRSGRNFTVGQRARSGDCLAAYVFAVDDGCIRIHEGSG